MTVTYFTNYNVLAFIIKQIQIFEKTESWVLDSNLTITQLETHMIKTLIKENHLYGKKLKVSAKNCSVANMFLKA